ncbi:hypothetical protein ACJX0J_041291 [Zea mays]
MLIFQFDTFIFLKNHIMGNNNRLPINNKCVLLIFLIQTIILLGQESKKTPLFPGSILDWSKRDPIQNRPRKKGSFFPPGTGKRSDKNGQDIESKALEMQAAVIEAHQTFLFAIFVRIKTSNPTSSDIGKMKVTMHNQIMAVASLRLD